MSNLHGEPINFQNIQDRIDTFDDDLEKYNVVSLAMVVNFDRVDLLYFAVQAQHELDQIKKHWLYRFAIAIKSIPTKICQSFGVQS